MPWTARASGAQGDNSPSDTGGVNEKIFKNYYRKEKEGIQIEKESELQEAEG